MSRFCCIYLSFTYWAHPQHCSRFWSADTFTTEETTGCSHPSCRKQHFAALHTPPASLRPHYYLLAVDTFGSSTYSSVTIGGKTVAQHVVTVNHRKSYLAPVNIDTCTKAIFGLWIPLKAQQSIQKWWLAWQQKTFHSFHLIHKKILLFKQLACTHTYTYMRRLYF